MCYRGLFLRLPLLPQCRQSTCYYGLETKRQGELFTADTGDLWLIRSASKLR